MDLNYPRSAEDFRVEIQRFLAQALPPDWIGAGALADDAREEFLAWWRRTLGDRRYLAASWPEQHGGRGLGIAEQVVLHEEFVRAGVPVGNESDGFGIQMLGNLLIDVGTPALRKRFLPAILDGSEVWCQGFSEPGAGSDLAGVRTSARMDGSEWVINGQKIWTSAADRANWIFALVRTDQQAPKHRGLSFLLVPMDQPGVEIRPIRNAAGYDAFNEVWFTDARSPGDYVVGAVGDGWRTAMRLLDYERGGTVTTDPLKFERDLQRLVALAAERNMVDAPWFLAELGECVEQLESMRARSYVALAGLLQERPPTSLENAQTKLHWTLLFQRYTSLALRVLGSEVFDLEGSGNHGELIVPTPGTDNSSRTWTDTWVHSRAATIYGGTSEIQRNIISERGLGLPR